MIAREKHEKQGNIVAEAIFTSEKVKEFPFQQRLAGLRFLYAIFSWLFKNLFVGYGPRYASNWERQQKQISNLVTEQHKKWFVAN
jgi:hypothetical protein